MIREYRDQRDYRELPLHVLELAVHHLNHLVIEDHSHNYRRMRDPSSHRNSNSLRMLRRLFLQTQVIILYIIRGCRLMEWMDSHIWYREHLELLYRILNDLRLCQKRLIETNHQWILLRNHRDQFIEKNSRNGDGSGICRLPVYGQVRPINLNMNTGNKENGNMCRTYSRRDIEQGYRIIPLVCKEEEHQAVLRVHQVKEVKDKHHRDHREEVTQDPAQVAAEGVGSLMAEEAAVVIIRPEVAEEGAGAEALAPREEVGDHLPQAVVEDPAALEEMVEAVEVRLINIRQVDRGGIPHADTAEEGVPQILVIRRVEMTMLMMMMMMMMITAIDLFEIIRSRTTILTSPRMGKPLFLDGRILFRFKVYPWDHNICV